MSQPITDDCLRCKGQGEILLPAAFNGGEEGYEMCHLCDGSGLMTPGEIREYLDYEATFNL